MKRIIITANSQSMRAFRLVPRFAKDHCEFDVSEIDLPAEVTIPRPWLDLERRFWNMAGHVNKLIVSENPDSWVLTAPLGTLAHLLPSLKDPVKNRLGCTKIEDLSALPATQIARRFAPSQAAA